jgi:hypothetical protein
VRRIINSWDKVQKPSRANTLPTKWVFLYKKDVNGYVQVTKFKARLCVRGDLQPGVNKNDIAAITAAYRTFLLLTCQSKHDIDNRQPFCRPGHYSAFKFLFHE